MKIKNQCGGNKNPNGGCSTHYDILPLGRKVITLPDPKKYTGRIFVIKSNDGEATCINKAA